MSTEVPVKDKAGRAPIKLAPFKGAIRQTEPHRHKGYFELIFLTAGAGVHVVDERERERERDSYIVKPPVLFVIRRDQVHFWQLTTPGEGYVLLVQKQFVDALEDGRLRALFASISVHNCMLLDESQTVEKLWAALLDELTPEREAISEVAEWVLKALLAKIVGVASPALKILKGGGGLYEQFLYALDEVKTVKRTVAYYAELLHVTPQNLNNACRKAVDRPAAAVLGDFIMKEAKRLLLYTGGTVAQIAFALDFKDPSHFVKYFKRITGQTPQAFRRE